MYFLLEFGRAKLGVGEGGGGGGAKDPIPPRLHLPFVCLFVCLSFSSVKPFVVYSYLQYSLVRSLKRQNLYFSFCVEACQILVQQQLGMS